MEEFRFQFPCSASKRSTQSRSVRCMVDEYEAECVVRYVLKEGMQVSLVPPSKLNKDQRDLCLLEQHLNGLLGIQDKNKLSVKKGQSNAQVREHRKCLSLLYRDSEKESIPTNTTVTDNSATTTSTSISTRHPNLIRLLQVQETSESVLLKYVYEKHSLQSALKSNRHLFYASDHDGDDDDEGGDSVHGSDMAQSAAAIDIKKRFLIYQLFNVMHYIHEHGITMRKLTPSRVFLTPDLWLRLGCFPLYHHDDDHNEHEYSCVPRRVEHSVPLTERWCKGQVSNFEYLMALNDAAGRTMADSVCHPVLPWVIDFTVDVGGSTGSSTDNNGWRDLTRSKFRLTKGDRQLDLSYRNSRPPHHITESLSEITYYIYMARRTPMRVLQRVVRSNFQAQEYPSSMHRMYLWTPDECIPEFFTDAAVFQSLHPSMGDLQLPPWCCSAHEFIRMHRAALESDRVSHDLHHWIDLNFGICLGGNAAVRNKNVVLSLKQPTSFGKLQKQAGFVQIFKQKHPRRQVQQSERPLSSATSSATASQATATATAIEKDDSVAQTYQCMVESAVSLLNASSQESPPVQELSLVRHESYSTISTTTVSPPSSPMNSCSMPKSPVSTSTSSLRFWEAHGNHNKELYHPSVSSDRESAKTPHVLRNLWQHISSRGLESDNLLPCGVEDSSTIDRQLLQLLPPSDPFAAPVQSPEAMEYLDAFCRESEQILQPCYDSSSWDTEISSRVVTPAACGPNDTLFVAAQSPPRTMTPTEDLGKAVDAFAVGCIIAELYLPAPLFSVRSLSSYFEKLSKLNDPASFAITSALPVLHVLPPALRQTVVALIHPSPKCRPLLRTLLDGGWSVELFPSYFRAVFQYLSRVDRCKEHRDVFVLTETSLDSLCDLPVEALDLVLPSLLELFQPQPTNSKLADEWTTMAILRVFYPVATKLGTDATRQLLFPLVVAFYERVEETNLRLALLSVSLLLNILQCVGAEAFLKSIVPLVLDWIQSGTAPQVRFASGYALGGLASSQGLGPSLTVRYVLPSLVHQLGRVRSSSSSVAAAGCGVDDRASSTTATKTSSSSSKQDDGMCANFTAHAILSVVDKTGEIPIGLVVVPRLFSTLESLVRSLSKAVQPSSAVLHAILETLHLLEGLLPLLSDKAVLEAFYRPDRTLHSIFYSMAPSLCHIASDDAARVHVGFSRIILLLCRRAGVDRSIPLVCPTMNNVLQLALEQLATASVSTATTGTDGMTALLNMVVGLYHPLRDYFGAAVVQAHIPSTSSELFRKSMQQHTLSSPNTAIFNASSYRRRQQASNTDDGEDALDISDVQHAISDLTARCSMSGPPHSTTLSQSWSNTSTNNYSSSNRTARERVWSSDYGKIHQSWMSTSRKTMARRRGSNDAVWLGGDTNRAIAARTATTSCAPWSSLGCSWKLDMTVKDSFRAHSSALRALAVNDTESIVLTGSKNGSVRAWRLSDHPVSVQSMFRGSKESTLTVCSLADQKSAACCGKSTLHVWDLHTGASKLQYKAPSDQAFTCCEVVRGGIGITMLGASSNSSSSSFRAEAQLVVSTASTIRCLDVRDGLHVVADWKGTPGHARHNDILSMAPCGSSYLGVGCANGNALVIDQRTGRHVRAWKAHDAAILKVLGYSSTEMITVSADRTAVLWDLVKSSSSSSSTSSRCSSFSTTASSSAPWPAVRIQGLPDSLDASTILLQKFSDQTVLCTASGWRISSAVIPPPSSRNSSTTITFRASLSTLERQDSDPKGLRNRIRAIGFLPLRQLLLVGTEDGSLQACV